MSCIRELVQTLCTTLPVKICCFYPAGLSWRTLLGQSQMQCFSVSWTSAAWAGCKNPSVSQQNSNFHFLCAGSHIKSLNPPWPQFFCRVFVEAPCMPMLCWRVTVSKPFNCAGGILQPNKQSIERMELWGHQLLPCGHIKYHPLGSHCSWAKGHLSQV